VGRLRKVGTLLAVALCCALPARVGAAPRHDICRDLGDTFAFGVSSYGDLRDWAAEANNQYGADFRLLYVYILAGGMDDPDNFEQWYVRPFIEAAQAIDAIPVLTFYQLLDLGRAADYEGTEAEVVQQALTDAAVMRSYFDHFVWLLELADQYEPPVIVHVEPDSWGFMMWAMGIEGNDDATSVPVRVEGSGHPELGGFADHAGGLGQALLALRDAHAPSVRLGWHASNFRVGTRPEVVASFYSAMGDWDVLVGEHPHVEPEGADWWEDWDPERLEVNLLWLSTVVEQAGVPLIFWQMPIGASDWHLLENPSEAELLGRFAAAGAVALLFEQLAHRGETDPDQIRASGELGTEPPAGHPAGGTAADMRERVAAYSAAPLPWPEGSLCYTGVETGEPGNPPVAVNPIEAGVGDGATGAGDAAGSANGADSRGDADGGGDGCGCRSVAERPAASGLVPLGVTLAAALAGRRLGGRRGRRRRALPGRTC
jgi:hypothetical protein